MQLGKFGENVTVEAPGNVSNTMSMPSLRFNSIFKLLIYTRDPEPRDLKI